MREVAEEKLNISVLYVDAPASVSGAACRLDDGDLILINRSESEGRRNFDLGHELFHLLTWVEMPPAEFDIAEEDPGKKRSRPEMLADAFASGLLMPSTAIESRWAAANPADFTAWLVRHSSELLVSPIALYWRLVNLGLITKDERPFPNGKAKPTPAREVPQLYNRAFVYRLHAVLDQGHISALRAADVLDCSLPELVELFASYRLEAPFPT